MNIMSSSRDVRKEFFLTEHLHIFGNLSDRVPNVLSCTVPRGYNTSRLKIDTKVKYHYLPKDLYGIGIVEVISRRSKDSCV